MIPISWKKYRAVHIIVSSAVLHWVGGGDCFPRPCINEPLVVWNKIMVEIQFRLVMTFSSNGSLQSRSTNERIR